MSKLEVYQICCLGYSGSSMLNMLLDSVEGLRGLGEIDRVFNRDPVRPCILCCPRECTVYDHARLDHFYGDCAGVYPDARALVDSSKRPAFCEARRRNEPKLAYRVVLLFKTPHAYLHSWTGHMPKGKPPGQAWKLWADFYSRQARQADVIVWYRELARHPQRELERILGRKPPFRRQSWWDTDTHVIGGNTAVMGQKNRQVDKESGLFDADRQKNSGRTNKYQRRRHEIFVDEHWRSDPSFKAFMDRYYRTRGAEIEEAVVGVGLSMDWLKEDLWSPIGGLGQAAETGTGFGPSGHGKTTPGCDRLSVTERSGAGGKR